MSDSLRSMMMTACDLGAVTKPWEISRKVGNINIKSAYSAINDTLFMTKHHKLPMFQNLIVRKCCFSLFCVIRNKCFVVDCCLGKTSNVVYFDFRKLGGQSFRTRMIWCIELIHLWAFSWQTTGPWTVAVLPLCFQVAELVTSEFFEQGDRERSELKLTPSVSAPSHLLLQLSAFCSLSPLCDLQADGAGDIFSCSPIHLYINIYIYIHWLRRRHERLGLCVRKVYCQLDRSTASLLCPEQNCGQSFFFKKNNKKPSA